VLPSSRESASRVEVGKGPDEEEQEHGVSGDSAKERDGDVNHRIGEEHEPLDIGTVLYPTILGTSQELKPFRTDTHDGWHFTAMTSEGAS
jgi:hypothetical protein